ncbi:MAG TPA: hypothetical protein PKD86_05620, partial [Gemmatales bacterium]|nr:hypothetical protein [Gemmatales bacterium]
MKARTLLLVCLTAAAATGCLGLGADRAAPPLPPGALLENPLFLPQGQESYQQVFHDVYRAVDAYFPVASSNVYAGSIESSPVTTAGFWDSLRYGWWDTYEIA